MPDNTPTDNNNEQDLFLPLGAIVWLIVSLGVFFLSQQVISLTDAEQFPENIEITMLESDETTARFEIVNGSFMYDEEAIEVLDVPTGEFTSDDTDNLLVRNIVNAAPDVTDIVVTEQSINITYAGNAEADTLLRRLRNPINDYLQNERSAIDGVVVEGEENAIQFTTTDERLQYGRFVPEMIEPGTEESYASMEEAQDGSKLAQVIASSSSNLESFTIYPDGVEFVYTSGNPARIAERIQDGLNDFYPQASLQIDLWVLSVGTSPNTLIDIIPVDTGIPLLYFVLGFALFELAMAFYYRDREERLLRPLARVVGVFLLFWSLFGHEPLWDYTMSLLFPSSRQVIHPSATVIQFAAQHIELVVVSSLITIPLGVGIGILVTRERFREVLPLVNNLVNSGQTVPTIAIVAFMAPIIGFGFWPAIIALIAYGLLPVVRNTIAGLEGVDGFTKDSARGMGMTPTQVLFQVELPIAVNVIMAGIRTSMVINVGTATLGAFVGSGGLGTPIASGLAMTVDAFIVLGAIPAAILAILIDYILGRIEFVVTPRGLQITG